MVINCQRLQVQLQLVSGMGTHLCFYNIVSLHIITGQRNGDTPLLFGDGLCGPRYVPDWTRLDGARKSRGLSQYVRGTVPPLHCFHPVNMIKNVVPVWLVFIFISALCLAAML